MATPEYSQINARLPVEQKTALHRELIRHNIHIQDLITAAHRILTGNDEPLKKSYIEVVRHAKDISV